MTDAPNDPPTGQAPAPAGEAAPVEVTPVDEVDVGRRKFFRQFAAEVIHSATTAAGAAGALQRAASEAAGAILSPDNAFGTGTAGAAGAAGAGASINPMFGLSPNLLAPTPPPSNPAPGEARGFRTAFRMEARRILFIDQRKLPGELVEYACSDGGEVAIAIREMVVRGAPALGQAAAYGLALTAEHSRSLPLADRKARLRGAATALRQSRPTAVNINWAIDRMLARIDRLGDLADNGDVVAGVLRVEADAICAEATRDHGALADFGLALLPPTPGRELRLLTHCNTGPLACGQFGTALGIIQAAWAANRRLEIFVDETRPYLQGARLTAWELVQAGVPYTLLADGAAGSLLATGQIDAILVGADRIAANGDTANKVGTYPLSVLAARHGVPFYVCAPLSSVDLATADGSLIPIEMRSEEEVFNAGGVRIAPRFGKAWNPAFDVTPAALISAIVTEEGALRPPFGPALAAAVAAKAEHDAAARLAQTRVVDVLPHTTPAEVAS
ncbi:MAG TPA: S-methyl-5-thioribose-1-phosphate isomerase [Candidatus Limnocylindrales bacterium]|nr:S-methyl-5-thioribose-1-phosphate isomerase [Candidatus Limnocylindrales bacterium]